MNHNSIGNLYGDDGGWEVGESQNYLLPHIETSVEITHLRLFGKTYAPDV